MGVWTTSPELDGSDWPSHKSLTEVSTQRRASEGIRALQCQ